MSSRKRIVVADAGVLINLIHVNALQLLGRLASLEFVVIEHVVQEIIRPDQAAALAQAMQQGWIRRESLDRPDGLELFADLLRVIDRGEAASLAWAVIEGAAIACDDRKARREATARLGAGNILTTPGLLLVAIRDGLITVEQADAMKETLEGRRFAMSFASFGELI
jgi:predicted nucleic acid-binding protein